MGSPNLSDELAALRADVERLERLALTDEQRAAVASLARHAADLVALAESSRARRLLLDTIRSWSMAVAAIGLLLAFGGKIVEGIRYLVLGS